MQFVMGGSKNSSVGNSNGGNLPLPVCGCNAVMKMWVSNTVENPKRRFWKCRNSNMNDVESCELFTWDDELDMFFARNGLSPKNDNASFNLGCNKCDLTTEFLKKFGIRFWERMWTRNRQGASVEEGTEDEAEI